MRLQLSLYGKLFLKLILSLDLYMYIYVLVLEQEQNLSGGGGGKILIGGGKWGQRGRKVGAEGERSGDKGGGKWGSGTPLSTPLFLRLVLYVQTNSTINIRF